MTGELIGKSIRLRLVETVDAEYIVSLRTNAALNAHLSAVSPSVVAQAAWIERYKHRERAGSEFYFLIERLDGTRCGTVRVYDLTADSFCWGSWILDQNKPSTAAVESALLVYQFGFDGLGLAGSHFDVRKENDAVVSFHKKFGAEVVGEDGQNWYFKISKGAVNLMRQKYQRLLV